MKKKAYETKEYIDEPTGLIVTVVYDRPLNPKVKIHRLDSISRRDFQEALSRLSLQTGLHLIALEEDLPPAHDV